MLFLTHSPFTELHIRVLKKEILVFDFVCLKKTPNHCLRGTLGDIRAVMTTNKR